MRSSWLVLATLWLVVFSTSCQFLIVAPLLPEIGQALEIPEALRGTLVSVYALAVGTFALLSGPVSDTVGRRAILRVGTAFMAVALLSHAVAWSYASMIAVRALAGMAGGILSGAAAAYVGDVFPYHRRGWALGWVMSGMAFGQILGIPLGTLIADPFGFQAPFVVFGVMMVVSWVLTLTSLAPVPSTDKPPLTVRRAASTYVELLQRGDVVAVSLSGLLMMIGVGCYMVYLPAWAVAEFGATSVGIATVFLVGGLANLLGGPIAGSLSDRFGRKVLVVSGGLGTALVQLLTVQSGSLLVLCVFSFLVMGLASMRMSPLNALLTAMVSQDRRGTLMSLTMATSQGGFALGSALAGWLYAQHGYGGDVIAASIATLGSALLVAFGVGEPEAETIVVD